MTTRPATIEANGPSRVALVRDDGSALDGPAAARAAGLDPAPLSDMVETIRAWASVGPGLRAAAADPPPGAVLPRGSFRLLAPIPRPRKNVSSASGGTTSSTWRKETESPAARPRCRNTRSSSPSPRPA